MKSRQYAIKEEQKIPSLIEDKYLMKETIGKGTFGKVKLGIMKGSNKKVAIKMLEKSKIVSKDDSERVRRELDIISRCSHLNVIQTYEIINCKNHYFIIMEYCEGGELFNYIVRKQRLREDEAACFYYQLINGLEYIHSLNIVHRDLKPENLLLAQGNTLKIIDFGLSNYYNGKLLSTPCGSPCYASPEMVCGNQYNGFYIDVWSTGIILFAMLCGYLPFEDDDNEILFKKILQCRLQYPNHVSHKAKGFLQKILQTDPEKRIKLNEIKQEPFYQRGKCLFELINTPIQTEALLNEAKEKGNINVNTNTDTNGKGIVIETKEGIKYSPVYTEAIEPRRIKIENPRVNALETEANHPKPVKPSIKEKINSLQSILYSKIKVPSYDLKTVSTNETGNWGSRTNTISNELRNTINTSKQDQRKTLSITNPKNISLKATIDSYRTKHKEIMFPTSPLTSFVILNNKNGNGTCSRINTEQDFSNCYISTNSDKEQKLFTSVNKNNKGDYLTFRNTTNFPRSKDIVLNVNSKKIQFPIPSSPKQPYTKPIITQPNFPISHLTERPNCELRQSVNNSTNTSYSLSLFQNQANHNSHPTANAVNNYVHHNKININTSNILMPNKKQNNKMPSSPIYFDYLNNKKSITNNATKYLTNVNRGKYSLLESNYQSYNGTNNSNMNIDKLHHRSSMNYKPKDTPIYINTESNDNYNKINNDYSYSRNNTILSNQYVSSTPKKTLYYQSNAAKASSNKQSFSSTLYSFNNRIKGIY